MTRKSSIFTIVIITILTLGCGWLISTLHFSYDFEAFFPKDDPETQYYYEYRKTFETDNDFFIVALEHKSGVFDQQFLAQVDSLNNVLRRIQFITQALGPTQLIEYQKDPVMGQVFELPMLRWNEPVNYTIDSLRMHATPGIVGLFLSEDNTSVAINLRHESGLSKTECDDLSHAIEDAVNSFSWEKSHVIGRALGQRLYVELMIEELVLFIALSLVLTTIFLFLAFRSGWGIIIPTLVVLMSIVWTLGFIRIIGKDLDLMLTVLPTILFVVGMSDSVHVLTKYLQELRNGRDKIDAIRYAFKSIRLATFLTALTTAIGFLTLIFSNIQPISDFGIYTSVGVMLAYGLTYTMLPAILILAKPKRLYVFAMGEDFWTAKLHRAFAWLLVKRKWVISGSILVLVLSFFSMSTIEVDNKMLEDLRDTHILKQEFNYMENAFSGCRPFELSIELKSDTQAFSPSFLHDLDTIGSFLSNEYGVGGLISLSEIIKTSNKALNAGQQEYYAIPQDPYDLGKIEKFLKRKELSEITNLYYNKEKNLVRISGKVADSGRKHYDTLNTRLSDFIYANRTSDFDFHVTGTAHLIDLNNKSLVENMVWDLLLSVVVIGLVMGVVYKSWKMILLTIIPNLIPLVLVAGIMGLAGIPIKVSTSIIFNIAFGIAVDDTIHFLARVRTILGEGLSVNYAVKRTFLTTGKAMIVTTLILSGGFLTLILSDFLGTFYIGFLISLTLFIAIVCELMITPLLVMFFYRK